MNIEVELRSFISEEKYNELIDFFGKTAELKSKDYQETFYFDCKEDLRIQRNNFFSKIWMKKGKMHDDAREELEIKFERDDFEKLEKVFLSLGLNVSIKWFRTRHTFRWNEIDVMLDYTKGYGFILELEKMADNNSKESTLLLLKKKFEELKIQITPKEEFEKKFKYYEENWKNLV